MLWSGSLIMNDWVPFLEKFQMAKNVSQFRMKSNFLELKTNKWKVTLIIWKMQSF